MSTRANVVIKTQHDKLWFYRHSDGYPEGAMPTLQKFIGWVREGKSGYAKLDTIKDLPDWKVGSIEPTTRIHGDIEYLYVIDLDKKTISCYDDFGCNLRDDGDKFTLDMLGKPLFVDTTDNPWVSDD